MQLIIPQFHAKRFAHAHLAYVTPIIIFTNDITLMQSTLHNYPDSLHPSHSVVDNVIFMKKEQWLFLNDVLFVVKP